MVIKVRRKKLIKYETICTDMTCRNVITCDSSDITYNKTYSMGHECGSKQGIVCPDCHQVLDIKDFKTVA